jgi:hypothetical protein
MKIKRRRDFWCGLVSPAWARLRVGRGTWPLGHWAAPGPGFFGCASRSCCDHRRRHAVRRHDVREPGRRPDRPLGSRPLALLLLAMIAFALALPRLGLIATVLLVVLLASLAAPSAAASGPRAAPRGDGCAGAACSSTPWCRAWPPGCCATCC